MALLISFFCSSWCLGARVPQREWDGTMLHFNFSCFQAADPITVNGPNNVLSVYTVQLADATQPLRWGGDRGTEKGRPQCPRCYNLGALLSMPSAQIVIQEATVWRARSLFYAQPLQGWRDTVVAFNTGEARRGWVVRLFYNWMC